MYNEELPQLFILPRVGLVAWVLGSPISPEVLESINRGRPVEGFEPGLYRKLSVLTAEGCVYRDAFKPKMHSIFANINRPIASRV